MIYLIGGLRFEPLNEPAWLVNPFLVPGPQVSRHACMSPTGDLLVTSIFVGEAGLSRVHMYVFGLVERTRR